MSKIVSKLTRLAIVSSTLAVLGTTMALPMTAYASPTPLGDANAVIYCQKNYSFSGETVAYTNYSSYEAQHTLGSMPMHCEHPSDNRTPISQGNQKDTQDGGTFWYNNVCVALYGSNAWYANDTNECVKW